MPSSPGSEPPDPSASAPAPAPEPQDGGDDQLEQLRAQVAQLDDRWRRARADLDNYRKRTAGEVERRTGEARDALLRAWLETVDSVERALAMSPPEGGDGGERGGLRAVLQQMEAVLARHGLTRTGAVGEPFDPDRHEAIGLRESDALPDRAIAEVARSGWASGDRVLRPAQVVVARSPERAGSEPPAAERRAG